MGAAAPVDSAGVLPQGRPQQVEVDVIVGGPPCQGFSSIRPFRSAKEDDPRNSLFEEFAGHVNYFRPRVFVMENVVGLATHNRSATIEQMQECFDGLGYTSDWRIINAAHFGVPQKRERLVMIGAQHGVRAKFPSPTHAGEFKTIGVRDRARRLAPPPPTDQPDLFACDEPKLPEALTATPDHVGILVVLLASRSGRTCCHPHGQLCASRFQQVHPPVPGPCAHLA